MVTVDTQNDATQITLSPNRSINWPDIKLWLCLLSLPALIVGIGWFVVGVWIILPFVGLELGLLSFFMYKVCYQNYRRERITIERDKVIFSTGINKADQQLVFPRPDCYLDVHQPHSPMDNLHLSLKNEGQTQEIGEFLNNDDRESARQSIRRAGLIECSNRWWHSQA